MRLHLPKTLLAAVLAACAALPTWADTQYGWKDGAPAVSTDGGATWRNISYTDGGAASAGTLTVSGDDSAYRYTTAVSITAISAREKDVKITATANKTEFLRGDASVTSVGNSLWITGSQRFDNGTGNLANFDGFSNVYITSAQLYAAMNSNVELSSNYFLGSGVSVDSVNGTLRLDGAGTITFDKAVTLVGDASVSRADGTGKVVFNGLKTEGYTFSINGSQKVEASDVVGGGNVTLNGSSTLALSRDNTIGTLTLNGSSTLALSGDNTIGTLTLSAAANSVTVSSGTTTVSTISNTNTGSIILNGGTLAVSSTGDFSIAGVRFNGGLLDVTSVTGTLSITGTSSWDSGVAREEIVRTSSATQAQGVASSLTRDVNYWFEDEGASVYRVRRDLLSNVNAITVSNTNGNRIVISSITSGPTDGEVTYNNVTLNETLTGDKVILDGLTGWLGYNGDTIRADLEIRNTVSNVNGNDGGTITFSGAITGSGTLSFDWNKDGVGESTSNTYVFTGDLSGFSGTIQDATTLHVTIGGTPATEAAKKVNATIDIAGALTVNREASFTKAITVGGALNVNSQATFEKAITVRGKLTVNADSSIAGGTITGNVNLKSGVLTVTSNLALSNELDMKGGAGTGGPCSGYAKVAQNATLSVTNSIWGWSTSAKVLLEEGGNLEWKPGTVTITGKAAKDGVDTGLKFGEDGALALNNANHTVTNSVITYTGTNEKTLSWQLVDTDLKVESGTVNLAGNSIGGNLTINAGTVKTSANSNKGVVGAHTVTINAGGTLEATSVDAFGWEDGKKCTQIVMGGTAADALAQLKLTSGSLWQTTLGTDVLLKGYSSIGGTSAFKTAGGKIEATGTNNVISASMCVMDDVEVKVTGATDTLQIDNIQYYHNYDNSADSSGTVSVTGEGTLNVGAVTRSALKNTGSGSVEITGAVEASTISNTGSGSVTLSGTTDSATKLISSGSNGSLAAQGVSSLAEVKAENGGSITLRMAAADDLTAVSLTDLVIGNGSSVSVQVSDGTDGGTASVDNITVGQGTTLGANLTLGEGAGMSFNVAGLTGADGEAAICTLTGSLTLGSNVELHLLNLGMLEKGKSITLFTGVTGFTYSVATSVATLSDDDISTGVDAAQIFGNVDRGFFTVKYVGNNVILTASSNVPEPTTATLSLLALMGLAARRRRRKA